MCLYHARVAQGAGKNADRAAAECSQVDGLVVLALDRERDVVQVAPGDLDHLTRGEHDVAAVAGDHRITVHSDIGSHQVDVASARTDAAPGLDVAGRGLRREFEFAGLEVLVVQIERGGNKTLRVDDTAGAEHDAVGIDQEHPAVGPQRAVDLALEAGVLRLDAVEYRTGGILLLEVGGFRGANRKTLPVDDRAGRVGDRELVALGL